MGDGGLARIRHEVVENLIENWGESAYTYAVEKLIWYEDKGDEFGYALWKEVINELKEKDNESIDMGKTD